MSLFPGKQVLKLIITSRADLENARVKSEYERGYKVLLDFFGEHL